MICLIAMTVCPLSAGTFEFEILNADSVFSSACSGAGRDNSAPDSFSVVWSIILSFSRGVDYICRQSSQVPLLILFIVQ